MPKLTRDNPSRLSYRVSFALLVLGATALILFGYVGMGRGNGTFAFDSLYFYVSGEMWENGTTPYDPAAFKNQMDVIANIQSVSYAYPPNSAPFSLTLSVGSISLGQVISGLINLASIIGILAFTHYGARLTQLNTNVPAYDRRAAEVTTWALIIGNPFTAHVVWMGQTTLFSAALLLGSWLLASRRLDLLSGIFLGISAIKPQLVLLVGFWFILDRRWQLICVSALTVVIMSGWPLWVNGFNGSWGAWIHSLIDYQDGSYNELVFKHVFGLRSLFATIGVSIPSTLPLALICTVLLYYFRKDYQVVWLIGPLIAISVLLVYAHDYDLAPLAIMAFPLLIAARGNRLAMTTIIVLAFTIYFPQRIWEKLDLAQFARSREIALLVLVLFYLGMCRVGKQAEKGDVVIG